MFVRSLLLTLAMLYSPTIVSAGDFGRPAENLVEKFTSWIREFRVEIHSGSHYDTMYRKWTDNDDFIRQVNYRNLTYSLGHNQFSGMDLDEFRRYLWDERLPKVVDTTFRERMVSSDSIDVSALPASVNWVSAGGVTPVKDQGQCGSCWSFSTTGALESAFFNKMGNLQSFSEQQLVDCDNLKNGGKDHGCNGGLMDNAFSWIGKNGGLCTEAAYPYVSGTTQTAGTCETKCSAVSGSKVSKFVDVTANSDSAMMTALAQQTVAIAIEADQREFQLYKSGVFTGACGTTLDHGVLTVGYGTMSGTDYYLVKNSWGTTWGANGYIYLGRGINPETGAPYHKGSGQCGMLGEASYPSL